MTTTIVGVHGIWNHRRDPVLSNSADLIAAQWTTALAEGAFGPLPQDVRLSAAYYSHRLRPAGQAGDEDTNLDQLSPLAQTLVTQWLDQADPGRGTPQGQLTRNLRQDIARYATRLQLNQHILEQAIALVFGEVSRYLDPDTPNRILARADVANTIAVANRNGTTIVIAHSLGSIVTYEALHAYPHLIVDHLITIGSPLALPHAVFHRLQPTPQPHGSRPPNTRYWTNIADTGDLIAIPPFGVRDNFRGVDHDTETTIHPLDFHLVGNYLKTQSLADALTRTIQPPS